MISQKLVDELKQIIEEDYKKDLSDQEAMEMGNSLVNYFDLLITIDEKNKRKEREKTEKIKSNL